MRSWRVVAALALVMFVSSLAPAGAAIAADGEPVAVTVSRIVPGTIDAGDNARVEARIVAAADIVASIDAVVAAPDGTVVWHHTWSDHTLLHSKVVNLAATWDTPADLASGDYALTVRVLDGDGAALAPERVESFAVRGSPPPAPSSDATAEPTTEATTEPEVAALLALINDYRQANGAPPLMLHPQLSAAAAWHSRDMGASAYFGHTDSLGRDPFQRMAAFGYTTDTWKGENIAAGYRTAAQVFSGWKESPGHNANMLSPDFHVVGIGRSAVAGSPYGVYWATTFGGE